jgi:hypothetical protein
LDGSTQKPLARRNRIVVDRIGRKGDRGLAGLAASVRERRLFLFGLRIISCHRPSAIIAATASADDRSWGSAGMRRSH